VLAEDADTRTWREAGRRLTVPDEARAALDGLAAEQRATSRAADAHAKLQAQLAARLHEEGIRILNEEGVEPLDDPIPESPLDVSRESAPKRAHRIDVLLPVSIRTDVLDNLDELMPEWIKVHGGKKARQMRRADVLSAAIGQYWSVVVEHADRIFRRIVGR
jgi:hypothetical protein